ncbi:3-hydroxyacyl-CoA dehydrogenase [Ensifer adhaerens]|uniref:3-hydroxyacyl-CoA dehydrogenase n=1 Tax=Ensifer adhaerens TaxID=106592 RepID=A0A0L8BID8_ENSAD|nr:thioesterase family protein [Ensifer adhaerens]KOF14348.1 3-hydroxyacyl-CoA dehydrogenase [Ensifer adhaerens]
MTATVDHETNQPLRLWRGVVLPEWLDYNGHMTEHRYLQVFGEASDALYERIGVDFANAEAGAFFTLETHIRHRAESKVGTELWTETQLLGYDEKRLHIWHRLYNVGGELLATGEHLSIHVRKTKVEPASAVMLSEIAKIFESQRDLPVPEGTGSVLTKLLSFRR